VSDKYILDGHNPVGCDDVLAWGRWFESHRSERIVKQENIGDFRVSTVFLGLDHQYGDGPPLLFETMVFSRDGGGEEQERCSTWDQAVAMHDRLAQPYRDAKP
jgi:hypothetical protein